MEISLLVKLCKLMERPWRSYKWKLKWQHDDFGWVWWKVLQQLEEAVQVQLRARCFKHLLSWMMSAQFPKTSFFFLLFYFLSRYSFKERSLLDSIIRDLHCKNTVGHSICPRLSSDEAHFEKCLLWLLLTISTHSVPCERDNEEEVSQSVRSYFIAAGYRGAGRWTEL